MNSAALGDFLLADKCKTSSSLACKQLKIEHPPCFISFLSYALQTERAVLPNKADSTVMCPGLNEAPLKPVGVTEMGK